MLAATGHGGQVRIGFEKNLCMADRRKAKNNAELIAQYTASSRDLGKNPASADEVRKAFGQGRGPADRDGKQKGRIQWIQPFFVGTYRASVIFSRPP